jgi:catechol-2,3-dioxygenase
MSIFDETTGKVLSPKTFAHAVLRTNNLKRMRVFYVSCLGGRIAYENDWAVFLTYDEEHHGIALL